MKNFTLSFIGVYQSKHLQSGNGGGSFTGRGHGIIGGSRNKKPVFCEGMTSNAVGIYSSYRKPVIVQSLKNYWLDASDPSTIFNENNLVISEGERVKLWQDKNGSGVDASPVDINFAPIYSSAGGGSIVFNNREILHCKYEAGAPNWMGNSLYCVMSMNTTGNPVTSILSKWSGLSYSVSLDVYNFLSSLMFVCPMITPAGDTVPPNRFAVTDSTIGKKRYISVVGTTGIDTSVFNGYHSPAATAGGSVPNTSGPMVLSPGTGWDTPKIDIFNRSDFILGGQGLMGRAAAQSSSNIFNGSLHELIITEGADDYTTIQSKMQALFLKWGN